MMDLLNYKGKVCVVTGAASGMGAAATKILNELGAEVYALDINEPTIPVKKFIKINLGNEGSINSAVAQLPEKIDKIFSFAGVAGRIYGDKKFTPVEIVTINFIGPRHLIESLIPRMGEGGSITMIASVAGMTWIQNIPTLMTFIMAQGFEEAQDWLEANEDSPSVFGGVAETVNKPYAFSKEAIIMYSKFRSYQLAAKKIRLNVVSPGSTETPMLKDFDKIAEEELTKAFISPVGVFATPEQQAKAAIFMNSDMADYISGQDLQVEYAIVAGVFTGQVKVPGA